MADESIEDIAAKYGSMIEESVDPEYDYFEEEAVDAEIIEDEEAAEPYEQEEPDETPGLLSYEDWIEAGKDPDLYKGKKAYKAEYERIQEVKNYKKEVKLMNETLNSTVAAITAREAKLIAKHKEELELALNNARENGDTDAALKAQSDLRDLDDVPKVEQKPTVNPVIHEFIGNNAILSDSANNDEFARIYNGKLKADGVGASDQLSQAAIKGYLNDAMKSFKNIYPEKFSSVKNTRQAPPRTAAAPVRTPANYGEKLRGLQVDDENLHGAAHGIYEMLKKTQSPEVAENYAKKVLGVKK